MQLSEHLSINKNALNYYSNYLLLAVNNFNKLNLVLNKTADVCFLDVLFKHPFLPRCNNSKIFTTTVMYRYMFLNKCVLDSVVGSKLKVGGRGKILEKQKQKGGFWL